MQTSYWLSGFETSEILTLDFHTTLRGVTRAPSPVLQQTSKETEIKTWKPEKKKNHPPQTYASSMFSLIQNPSYAITTQFKNISFKSVRTPRN